MGEWILPLGRSGKATSRKCLGGILVRKEDEFNQRETEEPVPIKEGVLIQTGLSGRKAKVMGQRSLHFWSKGPSLRRVAVLED
jgi:hypothetical protein